MGGHELVDRLQRVGIDDGRVVEFGEGLRLDDSRDGDDDPGRVGCPMPPRCILQQAPAARRRPRCVGPRSAGGFDSTSRGRRAHEWSGDPRSRCPGRGRRSFAERSRVAGSPSRRTLRRGDEQPQTTWRPPWRRRRSGQASTFLPSCRSGRQHAPSLRIRRGTWPRPSVRTRRGPRQPRRPAGRLRAVVGTAGSHPAHRIGAG